MAFVQAKCENCGGILTVDDSLKAANCPHCGVAYIVQDSINYYNSYTKIDHLHAAVVNVSNEESSEGTLKAADTFIKLGKFKEAEEKYKKVTSMAPQNYRGWTGLLVACTDNFSKRIISEKYLQYLEELSHSASLLSKEDDCNNIINRFNDYAISERYKNQEDLKGLNNELNEINNKIAQNELEANNLNSVQNNQASQYQEIVEMQNETPGGVGCGTIFFFVLAVVFLIIILGCVTADSTTGMIVFSVLAAVSFLVGLFLFTTKDYKKDNLVLQMKQLSDALTSLQNDHNLLLAKRNEIINSIQRYQ